MCASLQPWGQKRWPHQVRFRVGWCLVDLPHTEEAFSISNSTLPAEPRGISTTPQIDITDIVRVCECVHACLHLIALGVEIQTSDSGVASLSEANELLRSLPFKHPDAAVLSPCHIWCMFTYMPTLTHMQTEKAKGTRDKRQRGESLCIRNRIWRTWTTAAAFKLTLTILVDGMRCHSFHIIEIPFHNLKKQNIDISLFPGYDRQW